MQSASAKVKQTNTHDGAQPTSSEQSRKSKKTATARELDVTRASRGVWLIKVPNYIAAAWKKGTADTELGIIRIGS